MPQKVNRRMYDNLQSESQNSADFQRKRKWRGTVDRGEGDLGRSDGDDDDVDGSGFLIIDLRFFLHCVTGLTLYPKP